MSKSNVTRKEFLIFLRTLGHGREAGIDFCNVLRYARNKKHHLHSGDTVWYDGKYYVQKEDGSFLQPGEVHSLNRAPLRPYHDSERLLILEEDASWESYDQAIQWEHEAELEEEEQESERVDPYTYSNGQYVFYYKDQVFRVPSEKIEVLYANYTNHGLALDFETSRLNAQLNPDEAQAARICLHLVKANLPYPPHLLEQFGDDEVLDALEEFKSERIKKKFVRRRMQKLERQAEEQELRRDWLEARIQSLEGLLTTTPIPVPSKSYKEGSKFTIGPTVYWSMNDEHWGKQSINDPDYTLSDQYDEMLATADRVAKAIRTKQPKEIIMVFGSDMLNVDSVNMTTTRGTQQSNTAAVGEIADRMLAYFTYAVTLASTIAKVKVYVVPGNHDRTVTYIAGKLLQAVFSTNQFVEVDADPHVRKYHRCGRTLLTLMHGDIKPKDLVSIAYSEAAQKWPDIGFTKHIIIQGHLHRFDLSMSTHSGTQMTTTTAASPKGGWEGDFYGRVEDRRVTLYTIKDDDYISQVDFIEVGREQSR